MKTATVSTKKQTALRFDSELIESLKIAAKKEHRSLNNFVENILIQAMHKDAIDENDYEPNPTTLEAMKEARAGKFAGTIDTSSVEAFIKSCSE